MKRLLVTMLLAGAISMGACGTKSQNSASSKKSLEAAGYKVTAYSATEAKALITGLKYDGYDLHDAIYAEKGEEANKDIMLAFYFSSIDQAEKFMSDNENFNLNLMYDYGRTHLGENLTQKVGMHNNVAYVGSETSFAIAF